MDYLAFVYAWSSRDLRKIIVILLKSWLVDGVKKINYVHSYLLKNGKNVEKNEEKILLINTQDENKLNEFLLKNFPQIKRIGLN